MSISFGPRRLVAALLTLALLGALPIPAAGATSTTTAGPASAEAAPAPWWVDWLKAFDRDRDRIDDEAEALAAEKPSSLVPVIVTFVDRDFDLDTLVATVDGVSVAPFRTQPMVDMDVPASKLSLLSTFPGVAAVQYDRPLVPFLGVSTPATQASNGSGANTFYNGSTAEDLGYTGQGMTVAVLDTGVQEQHHAFTGKYVAGTDVSAQIPVGAACVGAVDDQGHGTHVASTAVGNMPADGLPGTAKGAKLVEVRIAVGGATAQLGPATIGSTNRGFEFVKLYNDRLAAGNPLCGPNDDHIDVATLSFGSLGRGGPNAGTTEPFIDALVNSGVAVTVAVGNCGPSPSSTCSFGDTDNGIASPGNAAGAIGVASFSDGGTVNRANDVISSFSSRGPVPGGTGDTTAGGATSAADLDDRYRKPDISAPGENINAAGPAPFLLSSNSGTSMAAPHVAGIAALLLEVGEDAKESTGGVNVMASTGNGFNAAGDYVPGQYPVRDAIINSGEYKVAGSLAKWTGPNSAGMQWNNAWGYGQVNAFGAVCWAWANVLLPAGATPPAAVASKCTLTPDPDPTSEPTPDPTPTPTLTPTPEPTTPAGAEKTYYFHSLSGDNTIDQAVDGATFDDKVSEFGPGAHSIARDLPGFQNAGAIEVVDPTWRGTLSEPASSVAVNFWAEQIVDQAQGGANFTVRVLPSGGTAYYELLPVIELADVPAGIINVEHTFTGMRASATAPEEPLDLPAGPLTFTIRGTYVDSDVSTEIFYDSTEYPAGFSVNAGGGTTSPSPTPTPTPTTTPTTDPTTPPPGGACGDYTATPNDPFFSGEDFLGGDGGGQWGLRKINAPEVWATYGITGCDVTVAVLDTGLDVGEGNDTHPDFRCQGKVNLVPGTDLVQGDDVANDQNGHGTHVAGIIGACTDNGTGVAGVAPDSTILPVRVLDAEGSGNVEDLVAGILKATDSGAHVINMSLGWPSALSVVEPVEHVFPEVDEAIEYARSKGVVVVAAAGNESFPICAIPAIAEDVICVGSSDTRDLNSWYGNFPFKHDADEDFGPGLLAPGGSGTFGLAFCEQTDEEIVSTYLREGDACGEVGYEGIFGTSMASPHVAGVAALAYERIGGVRSAENGRAIVDAIISSAVDLYAPGYDPVSGYGRLDALAAVEAIEAAPVTLATTLELTDSSADSGQHSDDATFSALLKDEDGAAIPGAEVVFELVGENGTTEWTAETDQDGLASATRKLTHKAGAYSLTVRYAGEEGVFEASSTQGGFVIDREETVTSLDVKGKGKARQLTASLDEDGGPLAGREIVFYADGVEIARGTTGADGSLTIDAPLGYRGDHYLFEARYLGEENFAGSGATYQT